MTPQAPLLGFSLMCSSRSPSDAEQAQLGTPSVDAIVRVNESGNMQASGWVETILLHGSPAALAALAGHKYLAAEQVQTLLDKSQSAIWQALVSNRAITLNAQQVRVLSNSQDNEGMHTLVDRYYTLIDDKTSAKLSRNPGLRSQLLMLRGGPAALAELERIVATKNEGLIRSAMYQAKIHEHDDARIGMVDLIISSAPIAIRRELSMGSRAIYTPAQIRTLLTDTDKEVRIGVLRRRELRLPAELITQGLSHPDRDLVFWYQQRAEALGSPDQLEAGLTNAHPPTRAGWIYDKRYTLSLVQMARALADPAETVVNAALSRHDIPITDAQLDACVLHPSPSIRFACVSRADFLLTESRWFSMATDWNSNTWRMHLNKHPNSAASYDAFFENAIKTASQKQLKAVAENKAIDLSSLQLTAGRNHTDAQVREAFCARDRAACK